jgi:alpha-ketoglutarate-dependent taurine dioxygenase
MKITKIPGLGNYGVFIDGVDFAHLTDDQWLEIGDIHMKNLVTIIRDCNLKWEDQSDWCTKWGDTRYNIRYNILKKYPGKTFTEVIKLAFAGDSSVDDIDKVRLTNIAHMQETSADGKNVMRVTGKRDEKGNPLGMFAEGELLWHSNESGTLTFTPGVALLASENVVGSATGFLTTTDYYENVSESFRSELDEMILVHKFTPGKINPGLRLEQDEVMHANMCPEDGMEIPMVIQSPGGIKGLHYSINTVDSIKGMSKEESNKVFDEINKGLFVDEYIYDHWYKNDGDFLLFDNSITLHRRLGDIKDRLCHRIQHDYSQLQKGFWQPYLQEPYQTQYVESITDFIKTSEIKNFKLPDAEFA